MIDTGRMEFMKGRFRIAITVSALLFLLASLYSFAESAQSVEPESASADIPNTEISQPDEVNQDLFYTVKKGDSLYKIAQMYNVTTTALKTANNLKGKIIQAGQKFRIPLLPDSTIGDTITFLNEAFRSPEDKDNDPLRLQLAKAGMEMLGIRYRRGGAKENGFDCSGLVKNLFSRFNIELPRSSRQQYGQGEKIDRDNLQTGDLVFFSPGGKVPNHVGIYLGENKFLHAALKARKVVISDLNKAWYAVRYIGARRITDLWEDEKDPEPQGD
jgi:cell wall-associated NlpC family hydrolase